jgi:serralysin
MVCQMTSTVGDGTNNKIDGSTLNDVVFGKGGSDTIAGGSGDDVLFGDSKSSGIKAAMGTTVVKDVAAKVTFVTESAGYKNTLGLYVINADNSLGGVQILFANASLKNSGGDLVSQVSSVTANLKEGQRIGFFIAPDAFSKSAAALTDPAQQFEFRNSAGELARTGDGGDIALYSVSKSGVATAIATANSNTLFFTDKSMNADGLEHTRVKVDATTGIVQIGFEDLLGGGDRDFDDVVFTVNVGTANTSSWTAVEPPKVLEVRNDEIRAGAGNDEAFGGAGSDKLWGEAGNDKLFAGSGNDFVWGGAGNDVIHGGSGDDALYGEDGDDTIEGSSGNDRIWDGAGADKVNGGSGRDTVWVGAGNDYYNGGSGYDILDFSGARKSLALDMSKKSAVSDLGNDTLEGFEQVIGTRFNDVMRGSKEANVLHGGDGDDWFRGLGGADSFTGGKGKDIFAFSPKDVWLEGQFLGMDRITDFTVGEDRIDIVEITKNFKGDKLSLVKLDQVGNHVQVSVNLGAGKGDVQAVVLIENADAQKLASAMADWLTV